MFWNSWLSGIRISMEVHLYLRGFSFSAPFFGRTRSRPPRPGSSPSLAQDSLFLCQNRFFDPFWLWGWRPFFFCISLLSGHSPFSLPSTFLSLDNIFNGVPYRSWRNDNGSDIIGFQELSRIECPEKRLLMSWGTAIATLQISFPEMTRSLHSLSRSLSWNTGENIQYFLLPKLYFPNSAQEFLIPSSESLYTSIWAIKDSGEAMLDECRWGNIINIIFLKYKCWKHMQ